MSLARSVKSSAADDAPALNAAFLGAIELASTFGATGLSLHAARNSAIAAMVRGCFITRVRVKGWRPFGRYVPSFGGRAVSERSRALRTGLATGVPLSRWREQDRAHGSGLVQSSGQRPRSRKAHRDISLRSRRQTQA